MPRNQIDELLMSMAELHNLPEATDELSAEETGRANNKSKKQSSAKSKESKKMKMFDDEAAESEGEDRSEDEEEAEEEIPKKKKGAQSRGKAKTSPRNKKSALKSAPEAGQTGRVARPETKAKPRSKAKLSEDVTTDESRGAKKVKVEEDETNDEDNHHQDDETDGTLVCSSSANLGKAITAWHSYSNQDDSNRIWEAAKNLPEKPVRKYKHKGFAFVEVAPHLKSKLNIARALHLDKHPSRDKKDQMFRDKIFNENGDKIARLTDEEREELIKAYDEAHKLYSADSERYLSQTKLYYEDYPHAKKIEEDARRSNRDMKAVDKVLNKSHAIPADRMMRMHQVYAAKQIRMQHALQAYQDIVQGIEADSYEQMIAVVGNVPTAAFIHYKQNHSPILSASRGMLTNGSGASS